MVALTPARQPTAAGVMWRGEKKRSLSEIFWTIYFRCNENMDKVMEAAESGAGYAGPDWILGLSLTMAAFKILSV